MSANRGCDSYVKAILRALRAPAQVEVEPAEPAVAEPAPPDELHLTSSHTDKLIAQLLKRAESKPADEAACAPADAPADDSADDSEDDSREDGRSHNGVRRAGVPRRSWKVVENVQARVSAYIKYKLTLRGYHTQCRSRYQAPWGHHDMG